MVPALRRPGTHTDLRWYRWKRDLDSMRKVICFLCVLALALVVVQKMHCAGPAGKPLSLNHSFNWCGYCVEMVGVLHDGNLATPSLNPWDDVGWYAAGPRPGEVGSAVIDGHLDRPGGSPAVFWNLRDLHVGDSVMIMDTADGTVRFRVTRIALYHPQQAPIHQIFGNESGSYLNLITCAGDWIASQHQTALRLVVYTTLVR